MELLNIIFAGARRYGKTFAQETAMAQEIKQGFEVGVLGIRTEEQAQQVAFRLKHDHQVRTVFEPMYRRPISVPIISTHYGTEDVIVGYEYPEPVLTGYKFRLKP